MEERICPYPGLRPFNEEESIFFRGREEHIEKIIAQLEQRKFVMLTGASGDGKSSLVYAGVIPNARAGFFKAKFNSWLIADFRPERNPLKNMALALADKLGYKDVAAVEKELGFGFSSLINLYKNSPYYLDYNSDKWKNANDADKKVLKRKAANLFVLVDQFEEFFTNSENYHHGKASVNSQAVVNLLLETAKIALAEDLPIYIICTMRSDYIGQCAAFRGLPEYIGFSQFFVPRLKRKEIHQVIEEPATLNGDSIANRLTETLINEIGEGFDQLPVLQHALNQIWNQAEKGAKKMDLIHLAKLSGLPKNTLPPEDVNTFESWFETVPEFKRSFFKSPSLENVLNTHANELYETAHEYYNSKNDNKISKEEAAAIIKIAFQCLTKIDNSRAVRNRMTLQEITNVINQPDITTEKVGKVLDIFRLPGNTLIKPYIGANFMPLHGNDVLDITHESLIRNWDLLTEWGKEEYENLLNYLDFSKQMQRWLNNGKAKGYLLPIGPLTFFEGWYNRCKPNKFWIVRYDDSELSQEEKLKNAEETLKNAQEFINLSARRLFFTRTVMKYGANRLLAIVGITFLAITCTYYYFDYRSKQNSSVISSIEQRGLQLLPSNKVTPFDKADFLINYERLHPNSFEKVLDKYNDTTAFDICFQVFAKAENYDANLKDTINPIVFRAVNNMDMHLEKIIKDEVLKKKEFTASDFSRLNEMVNSCFFIQYYDANQVVKHLLEKNLLQLHKSVEKVLDSPIDSLKDASFTFNESLCLLFALNTNNLIDLSGVASKITPFEYEKENKESKKRFDKLFPKGNTWKISWQTKLAHNGGYLVLAYAYAYKGKTAQLRQCLDTLLTENRDYKSAYYQNFPDIIRCLISYNNISDKELDSVIQWYCTKTEVAYSKILDILMDQVSYQVLDKWRIYNSSNNTDPNPYDLFPYGNLSEEKRKYIGTVYANLIAFHLSNADEHNFQYALFMKKHGISEGIRFKSRARAYSSFDQAFDFYKQISPAYLTQNFTIGEKGTTDAKEIKRSALFLYPSAINISNTWDPYWVNDDSAFFASYVIEKGLFKYYATKEDMETFQQFLYMYYLKNKVSSWSATGKINYFFYTYANELIETNDLARQTINKDFLSLVILEKEFSEKDTAKAFQLLKSIDQDKIFSTGFQNQSERNYGEAHLFLIKEIAKYLAFYGKQPLAIKYMFALLKPTDRRNALANTAYFLQKNEKEELIYPYLDTLYTDIDRGTKFGMKLVNILGHVGTELSFMLANNLIKDVNDANKPYAMNRFIAGVADIGYYYKAYTYIPSSVSSTNELELLNEILHAEVMKIQPKGKNVWRNIDENYGEMPWMEDENGDFVFFN